VRLHATTGELMTDGGDKILVPGIDRDDGLVFVNPALESGSGNAIIRSFIGRR